jgi:hypothetical protein
MVMSLVAWVMAAMKLFHRWRAGEKLAEWMAVDSTAVGSLDRQMEADGGFHWFPDRARESWEAREAVDPRAVDATAGVWPVEDLRAVAWVA